MLLSPSLVVAVAVQIGCQLFKVVLYSLKAGRLELRHFISAGGMPSAHTAFVTALSVSVALRAGLSSELFGVSFVFAAIVVYDILRVRGAVQAHTRILEALLAERGRAAAEPLHGPGGEELRLPSAVGHSLREILAGLVVGGILAWALSFLPGL